MFKGGKDCGLNWKAYFRISLNAQRNQETDCSRRVSVDIECLFCKRDAIGSSLGAAQRTARISVTNYAIQTLDQTRGSSLYTDKVTFQRQP